MNSMERVLKALSHEEPDRVPLMLLFSCYGAKELGMTIEDYFQEPSNIVKAQVKMQKKYQTDCFYSFYYAGIEIEAMGGEVFFAKDGPPNAGAPIIKSIEDIEAFQVPDIENNAFLSKVYKTTQELNQVSQGEIPIIGVVMSPFSLPIMQMGFEEYIKLFYYHEDRFNQLMEKNIEFCTRWANAQLEAGATAICYFDPMASPTMMDTANYKRTGFEIAKKTIAAIKGPVVTHLASGLTEAIIDLVIESGSAVIGVSSQDDLSKLKEKSTGKISLLGNLNGIELVRWSEQELDEVIKNVIEKAGKNGGLLIGENHGEIPWQVSEKTLLSISKIVRKYGEYPLDWIDND